MKNICICKHVKHRELTDEEVYIKLKEDYKMFPDELMNPNKWKKLRLIQLKKEGKVWSS